MSYSGSAGETVSFGWLGNSWGHPGRVGGGGRGEGLLPLQPGPG